MAKRGICTDCGREFDLDRFNAHHQHFCPRCATRRRRKAKRDWYRKRYRTNPDFRTREQQRGCSGNRNRRASAKQAAIPPPVATPEPMPVSYVSDVVRGVVAKFMDATDPFAVEKALAECADRGRRLAVSPVFGAPATG